jgi:hypothetical protein
MKCWIPAEHPLKLAWDMGTVICSVMHAYLTHAAIRDRNFDFLSNNYAGLKLLLELWFVVDILLHFVTEHAIAKDMVLRTIRAVSARYLTTWFVVDVLSLVPGEWLFVRPIVAQYKAQRRWHKWWRRSRAVSRVTGVLLQRWHTVKSVSVVVTRQTGRAGVARLIRTLIMYLPKYLLVWRHMKAVVAIRILRQWHWMRKLYYSNTMVWTWITSPRRTRAAEMAENGSAKSGDTHHDNDDATNSLTFQDDEDYDDYDNSMLDDDFDDDEEDCDDDDIDGDETEYEENALLAFLEDDDDDGRVILFGENDDSFLPEHVDDIEDDDGDPY